VERKVNEMNNEHVKELLEVLRLVVHGPTSGDLAQPMGLEALVLALAGGFAGTGGDSVASGLHDIAGAIRELAEAHAKHQATPTTVCAVGRSSDTRPLEAGEYEIVYGPRVSGANPTTRSNPK